MEEDKGAKPYVLPGIITKRQIKLDQLRAKIEDEDDGMPYDKGWAWVIVLSCFIMNVVCLGGFVKSFGIFFTAIVERFQTDARTTSWVPSIYLALVLSSGPVVPVLTARVGLRVLVITGGMLTGCGVLLTAFVTRVEYMYLTYGIMAGIGSGLCFNLTMLTVSQYFKKRRGLANGLAVAGSSLGSFVLPPLFSILLEYYGFFGAFLLFSALGFQLCICGVLLRPLEFYKTKRRKTQERKPLSHVISSSPDSNSKPNFIPTNGNTSLKHGSTVETNRHEAAPAHKDETSRHEATPVGLPMDAGNQMSCCTFCPRICKQRKKYTLNKEGKAKARVNVDFKLFKEPQFIIHIVAIVLTFAAYPSIFYMLQAHTEQLGYSKTQAAFILSVNGGTDFVGRIIFGFVADCKCVRKSLLYATSLAGVGVISFLFPLSNSYVYLMLLSGLLGFMVGSFIPLLAPLLVDSYGIDRLPGAFSLVTFHVGIAMLAGAPIAGVLKDYTGNWHATFYFVGSMALLGALVLLLELIIKPPEFILKRKGKPQLKEKPRKDKYTEGINGCSNRGNGSSHIKTLSISVCSNEESGMGFSAVVVLNGPAELATSSEIHRNTVYTNKAYDEKELNCI